MSNELTVFEPSAYPALTAGDESRALLDELLGGEELGLGDFPRIKVPSGDVGQWAISTPEGRDLVDSFSGIILHQHRERNYWANDNPDGSPPDCCSRDMKIGVGTPGGACVDDAGEPACKFCVFGSDPKGGAGKACEESRMMFVLRPGSTLPTLLKVPPGSLKTARAYLLQLHGSSLPCIAVVTEFRLRKRPNSTGTEYCQIEFSSQTVIGEEERRAVVEYTSQFHAAFTQPPRTKQPAIEM